jgi:hypothetical protein
VRIAADVEQPMPNGDVLVMTHEPEPPAPPQSGGAWVLHVRRAGGSGGGSGDDGGSGDGGGGGSGGGGGGLLRVHRMHTAAAYAEAELAEALEA